MTNTKGTAYSWDYNNRLSTCNDGTVTSSYTYNALGGRVSKVVNGQETVYVSCAGKQRVAAEYDVNAAVSNPKKMFAYATYVDDPIAMIANGNILFFHTNKQFSVAVVTTMSGEVVERYGYDSYGKATVVTDDPSFDQPYYFTGRRLDTESGLYYIRARMYDADLGRFIGRDPHKYTEGKNSAGDGYSGRLFLHRI